MESFQRGPDLSLSQLQQNMGNTLKYFSTIVSLVLILFVQIFLSPYRSELEMLDVKEKDDNATVVAVTFWPSQCFSFS